MSTIGEPTTTRTDLGLVSKAAPGATDPGLVVRVAGTVALGATPTIDIGKVVVIDGTLDTIKQAVKAASTAAIATDPAAVVSLSPNSPLPTGTNVIGHAIIDSGTLTAVTAITNALPAGAAILGKVGIDQTTPGTTNGVQVNAGTARIGKVGSDADIVGGTFTRPNDTNIYASGDLVANNTVANSVTPITVTASLANDGKVAITRVRLKKSGTSLTNASFRVHFYKTTPTQSGGAGANTGDNAAWLTTESTYIGAFDITMDRAFSDGAKGIGLPLSGNFTLAEMSSGTMTIFALVEARAAYTPVAQEVFTLACEVIQFS